jgi:hypothetical protein
LNKLVPLVVFSGLLLVPVGAQYAFATLIDFDTFPDETVPPDFARITTQYEPCGIALFTTNDPGGPEIRSGFSGGSPPNHLSATGLAFQFTGFIGIEFSSPVSGDVSVFGLDVRHGGLRLKAFNSLNALVDTFDIAPSSVTKDVTMTVTGNDIVKLIISQIVPQTGGFVDGYSVDDLEFPGPPCEIQVEIQLVAGEIIPIDQTSLILASAQSYSWMIPVLLSGIGIGLFVFRKSA